MTVSITAFTAADSTWVQDTLLRTAAGSGANTYVKHNPSARYVIQTSDTSVPFEAVVYDVPQALSFYVNGVYNQTVFYATSSVKQLQTVTFPAGAKTIEIEEEGVSITGIGGVGSNIQLSQYAAPARRVLLYGTSIDVGYNCSSTFYKGWAQLARHGIAANFQVLNDSYAGASVYDNNFNSATQDAFVASLAPAIDGTLETRLYVNRQTNDYGGASGNLWSAATYQSTLTTLYAKLRAAYPGLKIYAISALLRNTPAEGTANTFGNTLADYRAAGVAAVAAANAAAGATFCFNLDGTAMGSLTPVGPTDGLHPADAGHATLGAWAIANWFPQATSSGKALTIERVLDWESDPNIYLYSLKNSA